MKKFEQFEKVKIIKGEHKRSIGEIADFHYDCTKNKWCFYVNLKNIDDGGIDMVICYEDQLKSEYRRSPVIFFDEVKNIFSDVFFNHYRENKRSKIVEFFIEGAYANEITFEKLEKLSVLLGTREINFEGRIEPVGYSKNASGRIVCANVRFPK